MISAWDVYWVMQLDSIGFALSWLGLAALAAAIVALWFAAIGFESVGDEPVAKPERIGHAEIPDFSFERRHREWRERKSRREVAVASTPWVGRFACVFATFTALNIALPSTKTAATMFIVPAIANNEAIHKEAGELYGLAKQALKEAVGAEKSE
jgi:hypothetical protein